MSQGEGGGRPTKIHKFLAAAEKILNHDMNAIIHTDDGLRLMINDTLPKADRICEATFQNWKAEAVSGTVEKEAVRRFLGLYKKALTIQRDSLFKSLKEDEKTWQKWAWIIERKFDEWNIRNKLDHTSKGEQINKVLVEFMDGKSNSNTE